MQKTILKIIVKHIFYILCGCLILVLLYFLKIPCLFRFFTGYPCPSCGMTRAFLSLLKLDFTSSFMFHPLLMPALIATFIAIHVDIKVLKFNKKFCLAYLYIFVFSTFLVYSFRLFTNSIP